MTSRERVKTIINHKESDKIPIDLGGMHSSGISGMAYNQLKRHLGINDGSTKIYDLNQQLVVPEQWARVMFQIDTVDLAHSFTEKAEWVDWPLRDGTPAEFPGWIRHEKRGDTWVVLNNEGEVMASMGPNAFYFDQNIYPYFQQQKENFDDLEDALKKISWTGLTDQMTKNFGQPGFYDQVRNAAKKMYEETDYSIILNYSSLFFEPAQWLYRNDEFLMKILIEKDEVVKLFEKLTELHLERLTPLLEAVNGSADVIIMSDDLGMQSAPMISPDLYREMLYPYHKKIFQFVKENSNLKTFLHSCGAIFDILPHLIDAGLDIVNPVQIQATGMDAKKLKQEYGKDIVFWGGGIDTQHSLGQKTMQEVKEEVRRNCEIFMKDGGFVFTAIHNMLPGIPPENIVAMFEEANSIQY